MPCQRGAQVHGCAAYMKQRWVQGMHAGHDVQIRSMCPLPGPARHFELRWWGTTVMTAADCSCTHTHTHTHSTNRPMQRVPSRSYIYNTPCGPMPISLAHTRTRTHTPAAQPGQLLPAPPPASSLPSPVPPFPAQEKAMTHMCEPRHSAVQSKTIDCCPCIILLRKPSHDIIPRPQAQCRLAC